MKKLDLDYNTCQKLPKETWTKEQVIELCQKAFSQGETGEGCSCMYKPFEQ